MTLDEFIKRLDGLDRSLEVIGYDISVEMDVRSPGANDKIRVSFMLGRAPGAWRKPPRDDMAVIIDPIREMGRPRSAQERKRLRAAAQELRETAEESGVTVLLPGRKK